MAIINRHECCWGFTLFKFGRRRAELWYCPSGYIIKEHSHPKENVELMYVFGSTRFYRRDLYFPNKVESIKCGWRFWLKRFTVKYHHSHWFTVGRLPLVFINFQKFLPGHKAVSAAVDFQVTKKLN